MILELPFIARGEPGIHERDDGSWRGFAVFLVKRADTNKKKKGYTVQYR
jgi:hypothetical protein